MTTRTASRLNKDAVNVAAKSVNMALVTNGSGFGKISLDHFGDDVQAPAGIEDEAYSNSSSEDGNAKKDFEWTSEALESLRLCRNRAYSKVNNKRRQHLPASMSSYLLKEWLTIHADSKVTSKELLQTYNEHFEQAEKDRKRMGGKKRGTSANGTCDEATHAQKRPRTTEVSDEDHSDKQWSETMLKNLLECGQRVSGGKTDLLEEWKKIYPKSTLTARNLKSRLTVYQKTRPEVPPPSKCRNSVKKKAEAAKAALEANSVPETEPESPLESEPEAKSVQEVVSANKAKAAQEVKAAQETKATPEKPATSEDKIVPEEKATPEAKSNEEGALKGKLQTEQLKAKDLLREIVDKELRGGRPSRKKEVQIVKKEEKVETPETKEDEKTSPMKVVISGEDKVKDELVIEDEFVPETSGAAYHENACEKHWIHLFHDADSAVECVLTDQLLSIRQSLEPQFAGQDIYKPKKPKGFASAVLAVWKQSYPNSEETNKTISFKLSRFDRQPESSDALRMTPKGRVVWTQTMLGDLQKARTIAEEKAGKKASGQMVTRIWKQEWRKVYPDLNLDWRTVLSRYNYHFSNLDSSSVIDDDDSMEPEPVASASVPPSPAEKVLRSTSSASSSSKPPSGGEDDEEDESADGKVKGFGNWNKQMKEDLLKTKEKVLSETPGLDRDSKQFTRLLLNAFQKKYPKCMESTRSIGVKLQSVEKESGIANNSKSFAAFDAAVKEDEPVKPPRKKRSVSKAEPVPEDNDVIAGFEEWNLPMIRDFIAAMDTARRKYASMKEDNPQGNVKLVPLLLTEWKEKYPDTKETVKTFLAKIKSLKLQKELIKKNLGKSGLLPKMDLSAAPTAATAAVTESSPTTSIKSEDSLSVSSKSSPSEKFKWDKSMLDDVVKTRQIALDLQADELKKGRKLSFHSLWVKEFQKIYPNSTYTSNNLSVHYWSWRKGHGEPIASKRKNSSVTPPSKRVTTPVKDEWKAGRGRWSTAERELLLQCGEKAQAELKNPVTSNEVKLNGFPSLLHDEWNKRAPESQETVRSLNMFYSRLLREGVGSEIGGAAEDQKRVAAWTPKHNRYLRECINMFKEEEGVRLFKKVIWEWRKKFKKSSITDEELEKRIGDSRRASEEPVDETESQTRSVTGSRTASIESVESIESLPSVNSRGQMCWNKRTIHDLFIAHRKAREERKGLVETMKRNAPSLSTLVHKHFTAMHPYCRLSPSVLTTKCYCWRNEVNKGKLDIGEVFVEENDDEMTESIKQEIMNINTTASKKGPKKGGDLVLRKWTQEMLDDMVRSRKTALAMKKQMEGCTDPINLSTLWFDQFRRMHPEYTSTKKNLLRKYKWYKQRLNLLKPVSPTKKLDPVQTAPEASSDVIRMRNIRKDVFHHIKMLLEEPKIFLPHPLPKEPVLKHGVPLPHTAEIKMIPLQQISMATLTPKSEVDPPPRSEGVQVKIEPFCLNTPAYQALAQFQQQVLHQDYQRYHPQPLFNLMPAGGASLTPLPLIPAPPTLQAMPPEKNTSLLAHVQSQFEDEKPARRNSSSDTSHIKLPGGATLVAVTDKNAELLNKPKLQEKPHVTITIGDKNEAGKPRSPDVSIIPQPPVPAAYHPLNIPTFKMKSVPEMPRLKPYGMDLPRRKMAAPRRPLSPSTQRQVKAVFIPTKIKSRLDELRFDECQFLDLLAVYEQARDEYIRVLKTGYLAFFPYVLNTLWREKYPEHPMNCRRLVSLVDMYIEEKSKGKQMNMEYLTKEPSAFKVTDLLLKQILVCHSDVAKKLQDVTENPGIVHVEMCNRWVDIHPEVKLTSKQLMSIYHMITYECGQPEKPFDPSHTEIDHNLALIWKYMQVGVEAAVIEEPKEEEEDEEVVEYDEENISVDQMQEWILQTEKTVRKRPNTNRPRRVMKNPRLYWTTDRVDTLMSCLELAQLKFKRRKKEKIIDLCYKYWRKFNPKTKFNKHEIMAKCVRQIRWLKKEASRVENVQIREWKRYCKEFQINEENVQVIKEDENVIDEITEPIADESFGSVTKTSLSRMSSLPMESNAKRNFHSDEDVLDYIREVQEMKRSNQVITWKPDLIRDLIVARSEARRRKRDWESWAIEKYGGIGFAYSNPNIKIEKVDDLLREEWSKRQPDHAGLSIWTLTAYARKFDNLKRQLIVDNNQQNMAPGDGAEAQSGKLSIVFHEGSGIPKYDLEVLAKLESVSQEVKDLIVSRQRAKERQLASEEDNRVMLPYLLEEEFRRLQPASTQNGFALQRMLWNVEVKAVNMAKLKPALVKSATAAPRSVGRDDEFPAIKPRTHVFPEDEGQPKMSLQCRVELHAGRRSVDEEPAVRVLNIELGKSELGIPVVEVEREVRNEVRFRLPPRGRRFARERKERTHWEVPTTDYFKCDQCEYIFHNFNNYHFHMGVHERD